VYNCERNIEELDDWSLWSCILVQPLKPITFSRERELELDTEAQLNRLLQAEEDDEEFR